MLNDTGKKLLGSQLTPSKMGPFLAIGLCLCVSVLFMQDFKRLFSLHPHTHTIPPPLPYLRPPRTGMQILRQLSKKDLLLQVRCWVERPTCLHAPTRHSNTLEHTYTHVHLYTRTYTHTYTRTHTHTPGQRCPFGRQARTRCGRLGSRGDLPGGVHTGCAGAYGLDSGQYFGAS